MCGHINNLAAHKISADRHKAVKILNISYRLYYIYLKETECHK